MTIATDYLERGFSVIPIETIDSSLHNPVKPSFHRNKTPTIPWQQFQKSRASPEEVKTAAPYRGESNRGGHPRGSMKTSILCPFGYKRRKDVLTTIAFGSLSHNKSILKEIV